MLCLKCNGSFCSMGKKLSSGFLLLRSFLQMMGLLRRLNSILRKSFMKRKSLSSMLMLFTPVAEGFPKFQQFIFFRQVLVHAGGVPAMCNSPFSIVTPKILHWWVLAHHQIDLNNCRSHKENAVLFF